MVTANTDNGSISLVDQENRAVLSKIKVGNHPESVCFQGNSAQGVVTLWADGGGVVVNLDQGARGRAAVYNP